MIVGVRSRALMLNVEESDVLVGAGIEVWLISPIMYLVWVLGCKRYTREERGERSEMR